MAGAMRDGVTISQVAHAAGVARSSVSRAFTRPEMLAPATVARIRAAAAALGYVPNRSARALSTGRHGNIALVIPDVANPFFPPMIRAAQASADARDYCVFLGNSNEDAAQEDRLVSRFLGQVEGLVLASSRLPDDRLREFAGRCPVVLVNRELAGVPQVLIDSATGIAEAVEALAALGHRRVIYVSGPESSWSNRLRRRACEAAAARLGMVLTVLPPRMASHEAGAGVAGEVLASGATAAIAFDDMTAHGLLSAVLAAGRAVPDDLSLLGCDDVLGALTTPAMSSVSSPTAEAGGLAVTLLCERPAQDQPLAPPAPRVLRTRFVARATTGPAPSR